MDQTMLFYTAVPVLVGGSPRMAGNLAAKLYARHGVALHWFGRGWHPLAAIYATKHPVSLPLSPETDSAWLHFLLDFSKEQRRTGGLLCLIPGSPEAEAFLKRTPRTLEEHFVILERPDWSEDPLYGLVHSH